LLALAWLFPFIHNFGQQWHTFDMPVYKNHHSAIAASNGKIYLFGGGADTDVCNNEVYEFNPADSSFTPKAPMPGGRCGAAVEEVNGKIYVFGGWVNQFGGLASNSVYEFDLYNNGGTWKTLANMPTKRANASATKLSDNKIYVIGGGGDYGMNPSKAVEVFDPAGGNWLPPAPSLLKTRGGHVSHEVGGKIYVMGGVVSLLDVGAEKTVEMFDASNGGQWVVVDSIPTPRLFLSSCKGLDDKIYAIGGYNYGIGPTESSVDVFDPDGTPRWDAILPMNEARRAFAAACVPITDGFRIFVFGGNNETSVMKSVEYIDIMALVPSHEVAKARHLGPQLLVFPNPANGRTTIFYNLPASGEVQISLYDNCGRLVSTLMKTYQTAGNHSLEFDTGLLPKGIYFGILRTERGEMAHMKLMVQ
jgi:N-acetylneuraminic acid mutarotase